MKNISSLILLVILLGTLNAPYSLAREFSQEEIKRLIQTAEKGDVKAQVGIGLLYDLGGSAQNYTEAAKWYRKAAEQGNAQAQYLLGELFRHGNGIDQNPAKAVEFYHKAAENGHIEAQAALGGMYLLGAGIDQNYTEAAKWIQKAAEKGNAVAQFWLCRMFFDGLGVSQDLVKALMWANLAATEGFDEAIKFRNNIKENMTRSQVIEAEKLTKEWKPATEQ